MLNTSIIQPDDWHVHLRDGKALCNTINDSAKHFSRILVMPNLTPPLTKIDMVLNYQKRIINNLNKKLTIKPYFSLYLNTDVSVNEIYALCKQDFILGTKLYPKGATTNSAAGVSNLKDLFPYFKALEETDSVLQIHGEVTHTDIFDREKVFIEEYLIQITKNFPNLRIVLEHISTKKAVDFITNSSNKIAATITPQHLLFNRNHMLEGGIRPHYYCLPILKRSTDQQAIIKAAISGSHKFFAGSDSAPHPRNQKEAACGCAGVYSAPFAVSLYAEAFDKASSIAKLSNFMGKFGAEFYNLPMNTNKIDLLRKPLIIPKSLPLGDETVIPLAAGQTLQWSVTDAK